MSLSPSTAQSREISELRNHLKWMDEERRKTTRKMTELEQKLAQQGRELVEREQRIQDLEWHITHLTERFDQIPDPTTSEADLDQRLQILERQVGGNIAQLDQRITGFQDSIANLTSQLRERTVTLAAESQTNLNSLATRLQEHLDSRLAASEASVSDLVNTRLAESETKLAAMVASSLDSTITERESILVESFNNRFAENEKNAAVLFDTQLPATEKKLTDLVLAEVVALEEKMGSRFSTEVVALEEKMGSRFSTEVVTLEEKMGSRFSTEVVALEEKMGDRFSAEVVATEKKLAEQYKADIAASEIKLTELVTAQLAATQTQFDELSALSSSVKSEIEAQIAETQASLVAQMQERVDALLAETEVKIAQVEEGINKMGNARELMVLITKMENDLEVREAEEIRLTNLISAQETRLAPIVTNFDAVQERTAMLNERLAQAEELVSQLQKAVQDYTENSKPLLLETNRRLVPLSERLATLNNNFLKTEASLQSLTGDQVDIREAIASMGDELHQTQDMVARQIETWQTTLDEQKDTVERFSQQWISLSNQYKEARMAVQNLAHWQKQLEQQKREASEMLRVESNRMQSRWESFMQEVQDKLKAFDLDLAQKLHAVELENEQKWSSARRNEQLWREEIASIEELILKLQQDNRNMLLRVQTAQANAIKKWPRLLMEEVEKVVETNTSRRLPASSAPTARSEISVVDAIEQGLITVDYADDIDIDAES